MCGARPSFDATLYHRGRRFEPFFFAHNIGHFSTTLGRRIPSLLPTRARVAASEAEEPEPGPTAAAVAAAAAATMLDAARPASLAAERNPNGSSGVAAGVRLTTRASSGGTVCVVYRWARGEEFEAKGRVFLGTRVRLTSLPPTCNALCIGFTAFFRSINPTRSTDGGHHFEPPAFLHWALDTT